eukprot:11073987-Ditylum_brightwellii.AAC.1
MQKLAGKLNWYNAWEHLNGAFYNHMKKGKNIKQKKIKIRLLYNGVPEDRDEIKKQLQLEMRQYDKNVQIWLSRLQSTPNLKTIGKTLYSSTIFDLRQQVQRTVDITSKDGKMRIAANLLMESTFA